MKERIGIFICECGPNIKDAMNLEEVLEYTNTLDNVVIAKVSNLLCSQGGKDLLKKDIKENNLDRIVIAACSPKEHEVTFKKVLREAGMNPFLLQIANIREQCAWIIKDRAQAAQKAKAIIKAAVKRVIYHEVLDIKEIDSNSDVLVVGAGISGISAALTLAQKNRRVFLVEQLPSIGGKAVRYEEVFPNLECASCMLEPKFDEVLHHEQIKLFTLSEVQEVLGFYGNFVVKINKKARFVSEACIGCQACFEVCPVKVKNEFNQGLNDRKAIYIAYPGALPNVAVIDSKNCLHMQGKVCTACKDACPFGAINYEEKDETLELNVGAIVLATGFDMFDLNKVPQYGYGKAQEVYTALEFERLLNSGGPTGGKVLLKNGKPPKSIALVHCVGSRNTKYNEHCSAVCCMYSLKFAHLIKKKLPDSSITEFHHDLCLPGKGYQAFCNSVAKEKGVDFVRMEEPDSVEIKESKGKISISCKSMGKSKKSEFDMVVLAPAIEGAKDSQAVAKIFDISLEKGGFFVEEHGKLAPVSTMSEGIFIAGCAQGPKDIQSCVAQAQAAAGRILSKLIPGEKLTLEPMVAVIDEDLCSGCKICIGLCPYKAITFDEKEKQAKVNDVLCRGCGVCVAACPSSAIKAKHFTDKQITAELQGLLE
ncbi:MAG: CoB--CoM heterodisulfide reductase iron-sulfur subunit A family protein [Candidatus Omnitrophota bacterium]